MAASLPSTLSSTPRPFGFGVTTMRSIRFRNAGMAPAALQIGERLVETFDLVPIVGRHFWVQSDCGQRFDVGQGAFRDILFGSSRSERLANRCELGPTLRNSRNQPANPSARFSRAAV